MVQKLKARSCSQFVKSDAIYDVNHQSKIWTLLRKWCVTFWRGYWFDRNVISKWFNPFKVSWWMVPFIHYSLLPPFRLLPPVSLSSFSSFSPPFPRLLLKFQHFNTEQRRNELLRCHRFFDSRFFPVRTGISPGGATGGTYGAYRRHYRDSSSMPSKLPAIISENLWPAASPSLTSAFIYALMKMTSDVSSPWRGSVVPWLKFEYLFPLQRRFLRGEILFKNPKEA